MSPSPETNPLPSTEEAKAETTALSPETAPTESANFSAAEITSKEHRAFWLNMTGMSSQERRHNPDAFGERVADIIGGMPPEEIAQHKTEFERRARRTDEVKQADTIREQVKQVAVAAAETPTVTAETKPEKFKLPSIDLTADIEVKTVKGAMGKDFTPEIEASIRDKHAKREEQAAANQPASVAEQSPADKHIALTRQLHKERRDATPEEKAQFREWAGLPPIVEKVELSPQRELQELIDRVAEAKRPFNDAEIALKNKLLTDIQGSKVTEAPAAARTERVNESIEEAEQGSKWSIKNIFTEAAYLLDKSVPARAKIWWNERYLAHAEGELGEIAGELKVANKDIAVFERRLGELGNDSPADMVERSQIVKKLHAAEIRRDKLQAEHNETRAEWGLYMDQVRETVRPVKDKLETHLAPYREKAVLISNVIRGLESKITSAEARRDELKSNLETFKLELSTVSAARGTVRANIRQAERMVRDIDRSLFKLNKDKRTLFEGLNDVRADAATWENKLAAYARITNRTTEGLPSKQVVGNSSFNFDRETRLEKESITPDRYFEEWNAERKLQPELQVPEPEKRQLVVEARVDQTMDDLGKRLLKYFESRLRGRFNVETIQQNIDRFNQSLKNRYE